MVMPLLWLDEYAEHSEIVMWHCSSLSSITSSLIRWAALVVGVATFCLRFYAKFTNRGSSHVNEHIAECKSHR